VYDTLPFGGGGGGGGRDRLDDDAVAAIAALECEARSDSAFRAEAGLASAATIVKTSAGFSMPIPAYAEM
jgi:hypothetical protein